MRSHAALLGLLLLTGCSTKYDLVGSDWTKPNTLIYILAYKDGAARDAAWAAFGADPDWVKTRTEMAVAVQVENVFMSATDYSPLK